MIKVGISGGVTEEAGELLRILINHPDVDLRAIQSAPRLGAKVQSVHYGLIGECNLQFTDRLPLDNLDALFICAEKDASTPEGNKTVDPMVAKVLKDSSEFPELRIIDLSRSENLRTTSSGYVFGLSEIYRKPLVRGAKKSTLPYPEESITLIALYPLAKSLLLNGNIDVHITARPGLINTSRLEMTAENVATHLTEAQKSFNGKVRFHLTEEQSTQALRVNISLPMQTEHSHIVESYENVYDDHNFTFLTSSPVSEREVVGTNKCLISLRKTDASTLEIDCVADGDMRGGAAEAVHILNLLFGLHERTGLALKASLRDSFVKKEIL
ncbi:MAG: hypothetical protein NC201_02360 [Prevotella sp.]|nr:hypothetical protein [Bacteroides sp.]MCM1366069.1 hypothetical protein [Prevotella sp.]MCM1436554.1 hypothetical protein [Prevotella sp.]